MILLAGDIVMGIVYLLVFVVIGVVFLGLGGLMVMTGRGLEQGRGRIVQSIICAICLPSFPVGTAIGAYGLWACWMNEESKAAFEGGV